MSTHDPARPVPRSTNHARRRRGRRHAVALTLLASASAIGLGLGSAPAAAQAQGGSLLLRMPQLISAIAQGAETVTYAYDAKGRLVRVARSGSVNGGVTAAYEYDRADNRTRRTVTGSPNPPQP